MRAYYNDHDKDVCAWLEQLIRNGDITKGDVDDRNITEVKPKEIKGYDRVHFFAGIGTWDYALNQAGWGDRPIWTASLPCQPFSSAGKQLGKADERHLLPHYLELVRKCRPDIQIGEQVERAIGHGWLDDLQANMEAEGYAVGHCVLGAHSVNSAHIRQRLYWVAYAVNDNSKRKITGIDGEKKASAIKNRQVFSESWESCGTSKNVLRMANPNDTGLQGRSRAECADKQLVGSNSVVGRLGDTRSTTCQRHAGKVPAEEKESNSERLEDGLSGVRYTNASDVDWVYCRDNKYRPIEPGIKPLVDGAARKLVHGSNTSTPIEANNTQEARAVRLKGYGNAIQAQTAEAFIRAFMSL